MAPSPPLQSVGAPLARPTGIAGLVVVVLGLLNLGTPGLVHASGRVPYVIALLLMALISGVLAGLPRSGRWLLPAALLYNNVVYVVSVLALQHPERLAGLALLTLPLLVAGLVLGRTLLVVNSVAVSGCVYLSLSRMDPRSASELVLLWLIYSVSLVTVAWTVFLLRTRVESLISGLWRASMTDSLTGLWNRRYLDEQAETLRGGVASEELLMAAVLDLDDFKAVNDEQGHLAGDDLLRRIGNRVRAAAGDRLIPVRFGGEEFIVVGPVGGPAEAARVGAALHRAVSAGASAPRVTCSVGVAARPPEPARPAREVIWQLIDLADTAMYAAKRAGKNQVRVDRPDTT